VNQRRFQNVSLIGLLLGVSLVAWAGEGVKPITEVFEPAAEFDKSLQMKVAVIQWNPPGSTPIEVSKDRAEQVKDGYRKELEVLIREAAGKGAEMVITSEFGLVGYPDLPDVPSEDDNYRNTDDLEPYAEVIPGGPSTQYFSKVAKELKIYLHIGLAEFEAKSGKFYNAVVAFGPDGKVVATFRKNNLFSHENNFLTAGKEIATYESPVGRVGITICADIYSNTVMGAYKKAKTDVIALSTSWAQYNTGMGYFQRAAKSYGVYVLAANQNYFPDSGVVNPDGKTQSHIRQSEGIAYGYLPRKVKTPR
jgi:predicted amidohydrolase